MMQLGGNGTAPSCNEAPEMPLRSYLRDNSGLTLLATEAGMAAWASCHGPGGYRIGTPARTRQNEVYIEQQLLAFADNTRASDMDMPVRTIAGKLTGPEMHALAEVCANEGTRESQGRRSTGHGAAKKSRSRPEICRRLRYR